MRVLAGDSPASTRGILAQLDATWPKLRQNQNIVPQ
jgi:hypothetical protein